MDNSFDAVCESDIQLEPNSVINDGVFVQSEDSELFEEFSQPNVPEHVENIHSINLPIDPDVSMPSVDNQEVNELSYVDLSCTGLIEPEEIPVSHEVAVCEKSDQIISNECINVDQTDIHIEQLCVVKSLDSINLNQENIPVGEISVELNESDDIAPCTDVSILEEIGGTDKISSGEESQKVNDDTSVRRSSRIRSIAEKKKPKCPAPVKTSKGIASECQSIDSKSEQVINSDTSVSSSDIDITGKQALANSDSLKKSLSKKERLSRGRGRPKGKKSENPRLKAKPDTSMEVGLLVNSSNHNGSSSKIETGVAKNETISKGEENDAKNSPHQFRAIDDSSSEGNYEAASSSVFPGKNNFSSIPVSTDSSMELSSALIDNVFNSKGVNPIEKSQADDHSPIKPEKVKSRWRRSCELEHGELLSVSVKPVSDAKTQEYTEIQESLGAIPEEPFVPKYVLAESEEIIPAAEVKVKPPQYEPIEENIYRFERKRCKSEKEVRRMVCDCTLTKEELDRGVAGCEDDCLNRLLMIECGSRCATGEFCSNKKFQKKRYVRTQPFMTEKKGWGLRVLEDVNAGSFIMEYVGEVLSRHEFKQRVKQYAREKCNHYYFMALKNDEVIDATYRGNVSRFINHSCSPNCETQKWTVNGDLRIGFFTKRDMKAGEELTFDYKFQRYGREAQKCHCESENCTGYIGGAKPLSLEGGVPSKVSTKRKKSSEEKKRAVFEDLMFDEELEKLCSNGGLRNKEETLILARLMVRAEDVTSRLRLIDVILKTTEVACLRLFVDYHGLSLIWSWMVDVNELDSFKLKARILQVLSVLPIPNKTLLLDSKVMNLVQKWSVELPQCKTDSQKLDKAIESKQLEEPNASDKALSDEPLCKKNKLSDSLDICSDSTNDGMEKKISLADISDSKENGAFEASKFSGDSSQSMDSKDATSLLLKSAGSNVSKSDEDSVDTVEEEDGKKSNAELVTMAAKLLQSWSSLKEVFRIPRLEQQKRRADELEADKKIQSKHTQGKECSSGSVDSSLRNKANAENKENSTIEKSTIENVNDRKYMEKIQVCVTKDSSRPRKTSVSAPRMTKHERRQLFALEVQNREKDQEVLRKHDEKPAVLASGSSFEYSQSQPYNNTYYYEEPAPYTGSCDTNNAYANSSSALNFPSDVPSSGFAIHHPPPLLPTPSFPENVTFNVPPPQYPDVAPRVPYPPPGMVFNTPPPQLPFLGAPPPCLSQPPPSLLPPPTNLPGATNVAGITNIPAVNSIQPSPAAGLAAPVASSSYISQAPIVPTHTAPPITSLPPPVVFPGQSNVLPANVPPFVGAQNQSVYYPYTQSTASTSAASEQFTPEQYVSPTVIETVSTKPVKLPPNWRTATDPEGTVYYYHAITRQTQWDPPDCGDSDNDDDDDDEDDDEVLDSPTYDEQKGKRKSTTTAAADTSFAIEVAKRKKEVFRARMSSFVVQCLNAYRKPECATGKIQNTEDFKYLARKLTHFVMAKELKHCRNAEELECNDNVKHKAKDYIMKYMSKFGPYYTKEKTPSDRDRV